MINIYSYFYIALTSTSTSLNIQVLKLEICSLCSRTVVYWNKYTNDIVTFTST